MPAIASGTIGAPVRSAISAAPSRNGPIRPGRSVDRPLRHLDEDAAGLDDGARRADVCSTPTPPRQTGSSPPIRWMQPLPPARRERRRPAAEEPASRLERQGMQDDERIHPAAVGGADEEVAARRQVLLAARRRSGTGRPRTGRSRASTPDDPVEERGPGLRRPAQPVEALDGAAARGGERLRADPGRRPPGRGERAARAQGRSGQWLGLAAPGPAGPARPSRRVAGRVFGRLGRVLEAAARGRVAADHVRRRAVRWR